MWVIFDHYGPLEGTGFHRLFSRGLSPSPWLIVGDTEQEYIQPSESQTQTAVCLCCGAGSAGTLGPEVLTLLLLENGATVQQPSCHPAVGVYHCITVSLYRVSCVGCMPLSSAAADVTVESRDHTKTESNDCPVPDPRASQQPAARQTLSRSKQFRL